MSEEKQDESRYVNAISMKEMVFDDGNSIIAVDIKVSDMIDMLNEVEKNEKGYAKFRIVRRKSPTEWGHTHFMTVYNPKQKEHPSEPPKAKKKVQNPHTFIEGEDDDMPF